MVSTNFEQSLTNCTSDWSKTTVEVGTEISISLKGTNGATFEDDVQIGYTEHGAWTTEKRIPASHENTLSLTWTPAENVNYTLMASATEPVQLDVTTNLSHCRLDKTYTKVTESSKNSWIATPDSGFEFNVTTKASIKFNSLWDSGDIDSTSTLKSDGTLQIDFTAPSSENAESIEIQLSAVPATPKKQLSVTLNLDNCTLDKDYSQITESSQQTWTATPASGYKFDDTTKPTISYNGGSVAVTSNINNSNLTLSFTTPAYTTTDSLTFTLSSVKQEIIPAYIFDDEFLKNASITEIKNANFPSNLTQIHLTATQKFLFDGGIFYVDKNNEIKLIAKIPKTNGTTAVSDKFNITNLPNITSIEKTKIYVCCEAHNSTYQQTSKFNAVNTVVYLNDIEISDGDKTGEGLFHVRLQAIDNCIFDKTGSQWFMDSLGLGKEFSILPNNKNVLEYDTFISQNGFFNLDISATKQTLVDTGGYVNIYKTNAKEISALSKEIILNTSGSSPSLLDSTAYIKAYYRIPFNISDDNLQPNVNFRLANTKSTTTTTQVTSDTLTFAIGNIKVPEKYNNTFDYQNTTCVLYLPFVDSIKLLPTDVINKTLSVNYIMDMYTGNVTVNVINSNHDTIYSKDFKLSTDLPFLQVNNLNQNGKIVNTYNNAINQAYLLVTRNIPVKQQFGYPTKEQGQLKDYHGYIECSDIQLNSLADSDDLNIIKGLLQKGVFIK